jgi:membrane protein implicated in regulation of membrane protease activity
MSTNPTDPSGRKPSRQETLRPAELVGGSALLGAFAGIVVLLAARSWVDAGVAFGVAFIVALVVVALFVQSLKPGSDEEDDLREQDAAHGGTRGVLEPKPGDGRGRDDGRGRGGPEAH